MGGLPGLLLDQADYPLDFGSLTLMLELSQLRGSGRSMACPCQEELHRCTQLHQPSYMVRAVQRPALARRNSTGAPGWSSWSPYAPLPVRPFPVDKGTVHVAFDSCTGSSQVPWTH